MVRQYKAGTAYVEVVPVFKDFQRLVAKHLKENLANKDNYKDLEGNLRDSVDKGLDGIDKKIVKELKDGGVEIQKEAKKTGQKVGTKIAEGTAESLDKDVKLERAIRAFGRKIEEGLGDSFMSGASKSKDAREEITSNLRKLTKAYQDEGAKSAAEVEKSYERIRKAMRSVVSGGTGPGKASKSDIGVLNAALEEFEKQYFRIGKGYSTLQAKAAKDAIAAEEARFKEEQKLREKEAKERQKALDDEEKARQKALDKAKKDAETAAEERQKAIDAETEAAAKALEKRQKAEKELRKRLNDQTKELDEKRIAEAEAAEKALDEAHRKALEKDEALEKARQEVIDKAHEKALTADRKFNEAQQAEENRAADKAAHDLIQARNRARRAEDIANAQDAAKAARERAKEVADASYNSVRSTARDDWREIGADAARGNAKQQRLLEARRKTIAQARNELNTFLAELSRVGTVSPKVKVDTRESVEHMERLRRELGMAFDGLNDVHDVKVDTDQADRALHLLRLTAEESDIIDWTVEIDDDAAKLAIDELKASLASITDEDVNIDVNVDEDRAQIAAVIEKINASLKTINDVELRVDDKDSIPTIAAVNAALDALRDKTVGVDITEKDAIASIVALRTALDTLDQHEIDIDLDEDGSVRRNLSKLDDGMRRASTSAGILSDKIARAGVSMNETTQAFRVFNPMLAGIAALGAPAISAIGGLTAGLGGLVSMAPGLIGGASAIGFAFTGLQESMKKYAKAQEAIDMVKAGGKLTKAQQTALENWEGEKEVIGEATIKWIEYTDTLKNSLREIQKGAREGLFPGLQKSIETLLGQYAEPLQDFLNRMGKGLGFVAQQWANGLVSSEAQAWFSRVADDALLYTLNMAEAGANLVKGFAGLTDAFRPFAQEFSQYLIDATGRFDDWANGLSGNSKLESFLNSVRSVSPAIGDLAKNIGEFFINASIAVEPFTLAILDAINGALDFVNALDPKVLGAILGAVGGLAGGLMLLSGVVAGVGAVASVMSAALSTPFTAAVTALGTFIAVSGTALGMTTAMSTAGGDLGKIMGSLGGALEGAASHGKALFGAFGNLLDALSPLAPVVADILADFVNLAVAVSDTILVGGLNLIADLVGTLADIFASLPAGVQESTVLLIAMGVAAKPITGFFQSITTSGFAAMQGLADRLAAGGRNMGALAASAENLPGPLSRVAGGATSVGNGLTGASKGADRLSRGFATLEKASGILTIVSLAVTGLALAFSKASENSKPMYEDVTQLQGALEKLGGSAKGAEQTLDRVFQDKEGNALASMDSQAKGVSALDDALKSLKPSAQEAGSALDAYGAQGQLIADASSEIKVTKQIKQLDEAFGEMASSGNTEAAAMGFETFAQKAEELGYKREEILAFFPGYQDQLKETAAALGLGKDKSIDYYEWMKGNVPPSVEAAVEAQGRQKDGLAGVTDETNKAERAQRKLIDTTDELSDRFMSQEEATAQFNSSMREIEKAVKDGEQGMKEGTEAGDRHREMFRRAARDARDKAAADAEAGESARKIGKDLRSAYKRIMENADALGLSADEAEAYARELFGIPDDVDTDVFLNDYATAKADNIIKKLEKIKDKEVWVKINEQYVRKYKDTGDGSDYKYKSGRHGSTYEYHGGLVEFYANGGLRPMDSIAQMVQPNTWRVVGDRGDVPEAYVPLNGSERSWKILLEALRMMPGTIPFYDGGIAAFAAGAVTTPAPAGSPSTPEAAGAVGDAAISEAMAALVAALGESWSTMLATMQTQTEAFYAKLLETMAAQNALALTAEQTHFSAMLTAMSQYHAQAASASASHDSALSSANASWRSHQLSATSSFMASMLSRTEDGDRSIRSEWDSHWDLMSGITSDFRSRESDRMSNFLNSTMMGQFSRFGSSIRDLWKGIWESLVESAQSVFGNLPREIGAILSSIAGKMNTHIVNPYNKVVKDLDLDKDLKISSFPVQKYATGSSGVLPGYTPGRDVYKFFSPEVGRIDLSGGEHILRPEFGAAVGSEWTDGVNAAARQGGVNGVRKFLGQGQAFADGGVVQSFAKGGKIQKNRAGLVQLGHLLQGLGVRVSEQSQFGGVTPGAHSPTGWHPKDGALDLNTAAGQSAKEIADFDRIMPLLYKLGWGVIWRYPNHYNHAHVDIGNTSLGSFNRNPKTSGDLWEQLLSMKVGPATGGGGATMFDLKGEMKGWIEKARKAAGEGALPELALGIGDKVFSALADAKSDQFIDTSGFGADFSSVANGPIKKMAKAMLEKMGWGAQWADLDWLVTRESGWRPNAQNPTSSAYGLFQFLNGTWDDVGGRKTSDPRKQLEYGLRYIQQRYHDVRGARAFWERNHWYSEGTSNLELPGKAAHAQGTSNLVIPTASSIDLNPETIFRDGGGPLPQGYSMVLNNLGHEETILPATPHEVTKTFRELKEVAPGGDSLTIKDSYFGATAQEVVQEIGVQRRMARAGTPVKF